MYRGISILVIDVVHPSRGDRTIEASTVSLWSESSVSPESSFGFGPRPLSSVTLVLALVLLQVLCPLLASSLLPGLLARTLAYTIAY